MSFPHIMATNITCKQLFKNVQEASDVYNDDNGKYSVSFLNTEKQKYNTFQNELK